MLIVIHISYLEKKLIIIVVVFIVTISSIKTPSSTEAFADSLLQAALALYPVCYTSISYSNTNSF